MSIIFNSICNGEIKVIDGSSLLDKDLFNKHKLIELNSGDLKSISIFLDLFFIPMSLNGSKDLFDVEKCVIDKKSKYGVNYSLYKLKTFALSEYKEKILKLFDKKKNTICNNISSLGYKYFDAHSNNKGNVEFVSDLPYQDFDFSGDVEIFKLFFIIRQFKLDDKKTSIYQEIKKYKIGAEYNEYLKIVFESKFFKYDDLNIGKEEISRPRSCIYINVDGDNYKTIQPIISNAQILKFDSIYSKLKKQKYNNNFVSIGGSKPQNIGYLANILSGKIKYFENSLFLNKGNLNNELYNIKFKLIPNNVFNNFNERKTYKKINHLNQIVSNSKTDKKLINEINLILDDLLEIIFITIDHIQEEKEDHLEVSSCENYKIIKKFILTNNVDELMIKLKQEIFKNLKISKSIKFYDKRVNFFENLFNLLEKRILNYV